MPISESMVQEIVQDVVIKKHLGGQELTARVHLFFQMQDILGFVRCFYMSFRITCTANTKITL